jgi:hypothetical protein
MPFFNLLHYTWTFMTFLTRSRLLESHPGRFKPVKNDKSLANVIQFVWGSEIFTTIFIGIAVWETT